MLTIPTTIPIDLTALTTEIKAVVPALEGLEEHASTLDVRRLVGEFDAAEQALIAQAVAVHDAIAIRQRRQAQQQRQLAERQKDPKILTDKERLTRTEIILGIEGG